MYNEKIISGVIMDYPRIVFKDFDKEQSMVGWVYKIQTTQLVGYDYQPTQIWVFSVYDLNKWDIIHKGDEVRLSIIQKQKSKYSDDGVVLKCNIVSRVKRSEDKLPQQDTWEDISIMMDDLFNLSEQTI
jgi:hypothetical protein